MRSISAFIISIRCIRNIFQLYHHFSPQQLVYQLKYFIHKYFNKMVDAVILELLSHPQNIKKL